jgi:hypothetical protein
MSKKLFLTAALAVVALLAAVGSASAFTATVSPAGNYTATGAGVLFSSGATEIICNVTLTGTLAASIAEVERSGRTIGATQTARISGCNNGATVTALNLPWSNTTTSVSGTLPDNATAQNFSVNNSSFNLSLFGGFANCLYQGNAAAIMPLTDTGTNTYSATNIETDGTRTIALHSGFGCPNSGSMEGTFRLGTTQSITVR